MPLQALSTDLGYFLGSIFSALVKKYGNPQGSLTLPMEIWHLNLPVNIPDPTNPTTCSYPPNPSSSLCLSSPLHSPSPFPEYPSPNYHISPLQVDSMSVCVVCPLPSCSQVWQICISFKSVLWAVHQTITHNKLQSIANSYFILFRRESEGFSKY